MNLSPKDSVFSVAWATDKARQYGAARVEGVTRAVMWERTAGSWVDLHPVETNELIIYGLFDVFQVGVVNGHAAVWAGSKDYDDLHWTLPEGYTSSAARVMTLDGTELQVCG